MRLGHIALAVLLTAVWGFNFVVTQVGLTGYPPLLLNALRFAVAALPVFVLPRPALPWSRLAAIAASLFFGQFTLLLTAMKIGLSAGLASVVLQAQVFLTVLIAAVVLRERPTRRQWIGMVAALAGLVLIATTIGVDRTHISIAGFILCLMAAMSWATGNILLRGLPASDPLALMVWLSALVALPFLAATMLVDGPQTIRAALQATDWLHVGAVLYLALASTLFGYGVWGFLLKTHPAATVVPFTLLVPLFGMTSSALVFGETFGAARLMGAACILAGVAIIVMPWPLAWRAPPTRSR